MPKQSKTPISFHFHPYDFESKAHVIEKQEGDKKRRYLRGISSGLKVDGDGEKMTEKAIRSFMEQANEGDILLYAGNHGSDFTDDIGILTKAEILSSGDWFTEYRLYDDDDNVGPNKLEKANTLWRQLNGMSPYSKPKQKGFSIEGKIPEEDGVISTNEFGGRVINEVELDGVWVVNRPSYQDGIINAVFKALGEDNPYRVRAIAKNALREKIEKQILEENFNSSRMQIVDNLESEINRIMTESTGDKEKELKILFDEFKDLMVELLLDNPDAFEEMQLIEFKRYDDKDKDEKPVMERKKRMVKNVIDVLKKVEKMTGHGL